MTKKLCRLCILCAMMLAGIKTGLQAQNSAGAANRVTAVRCLELAKEYMQKKQPDNALSQLMLGLAYDEGLSDLWYLLAENQKSRGVPFFKVRPSVEKALQLNDWHDYNRDNARILFASILSSTGLYRQALEQLDSAPFLLSADAECIRIKSYYCLGTASAVAAARNRIESDRRVYKNDWRFARLFFTHEYAIKDAAAAGASGRQRSSSGADEERVRDLAEKLTAQLALYKMPADVDTELRIYAAAFAAGSEKERMLKAFSAAGKRHPLYAVEALRAGILSQQKAFEYFRSFADTSVTLTLLHDFVVLITEPEIKKLAAEYLTAYEGCVTVDTEGNLEQTLSVLFERGRPASASFDRNTDGLEDWNIQCDFGTVTSARVQVPNVSSDPDKLLTVLLSYDSYPSIQSVRYDDASSDSVEEFLFLPGDYLWMPLEMKADPVVASALSCEFFLPVPASTDPAASWDKLFRNSSDYRVSYRSQPDQSVRFMLQQGVPVSAEYYTGSTLYAKMSFKNGLPDINLVDKNLDGLFETTETYGYDPDNLLRRSVDEQRDTVAYVFKKDRPEYSGIYIKGITIDRNNDAVPEYTEEYLADDGKVCSWDNDGDGVWDCRYIKYPCREGHVLREDALFYLNPGHILVQVTSENGAPVLINSVNPADAANAAETAGTAADTEDAAAVPRSEQEPGLHTVTAGSMTGFYWVDEPGTEDDERAVAAAISAEQEQGVSIIVQSGFASDDSDDSAAAAASGTKRAESESADSVSADSAASDERAAGHRVLAVRLGNIIYGKLVPETQRSESQDDGTVKDE